MSIQNRPRRSMLYVSGAIEKHQEKALDLRADSLIFDLQETVNPEHKVAARERIKKSLAKGATQGQEIVVRVNKLDSGWIDDDLKLLTELNIDAVLIPRIQTCEQVAIALNKMDRAGCGQLPMMVMIESPLGVLNAQDIAGCSDRVSCLIMNTNRLNAELGIRPTADRIGLLPHMTQVILAARAHGKAVVDGAHLNLREAQSCEYSCRQGRDLGFDGKTVVHPVQLAYTNDAFSPKPKDLGKAKEVIEKMEEARDRGEAVAVLNGHVLTEDVEEDARNLLTLEESIRKREEEFTA